MTMTTNTENTQSMVTNVHKHNPHFDHARNSFVANVNILARHFGSLRSLSETMTEDTVKELTKLSAVGIESITTDLTKGSMNGYRKIDIDLIKNFIEYEDSMTEDELTTLWNDPTKQVYYNAITVDFTDKTHLYKEFEQLGVPVLVNTHSQLYSQLDSWDEFKIKFGYTMFNLAAGSIVPAQELLRVYDGEGDGSYISKVTLHVAPSGQNQNYDSSFAGAKDYNPMYDWVSSTSVLEAIVQSLSQLLLLSDNVNDLVLVSKYINELTTIHELLNKILEDTASQDDIDELIAKFEALVAGVASIPDVNTAIAGQVITAVSENGVLKARYANPTGSGGVIDTDVLQYYVDKAKTEADRSTSEATKSAGSAVIAKTSETNSKTSETNSATSAGNAMSQAITAKTEADRAKTEADKAKLAITELNAAVAVVVADINTLLVQADTYAKNASNSATVASNSAALAQAAAAKIPDVNTGSNEQVLTIEQTGSTKTAKWKDARGGISNILIARKDIDVETTIVAGSIIDSLLTYTVGSGNLMVFIDSKLANIKEFYDEVGYIDSKSSNIKLLVEVAADTPLSVVVIGGDTGGYESFLEPPITNITIPSQADEGKVITLDGSSSVGEISTYLWEQIGGVAVTPTTPINLLTNPSFESLGSNNLPTGWTIGTSGGTASIGIDSTSVVEGITSLVINAVGSGNSLRYDSDYIVVTANSLYAYEYFLRGTGQAGASAFSVYWFKSDRSPSSVRASDTNRTNGSYLSTTAWRYYYDTLTAPSDAAYAQIRLTTGNCSTKWDHFSFIKCSSTVPTGGVVVASSDFEGTFAPFRHLGTNESDVEATILQTNTAASGSYVCDYVFPAGSPIGGAQTDVVEWDIAGQTPTDINEVLVEFYVRFSSPFVWNSIIQKLHYFACGTVVQPSGQNATNHILFANMTIGTQLDKPTRAIGFSLQHVGGTGADWQGAGAGDPTLWTLGTWHRVMAYVKMNTPQKFDGVGKLWLNGNLMVEAHSIKWEPDAVSGGMFNWRFNPIFGGGGGPLAADQHIQFDQLKITRGPFV